MQADCHPNACQTWLWLHNQAVQLGVTGSLLGRLGINGVCPYTVCECQWCTNLLDSTSNLRLFPVALVEAGEQ